jgi:hypothetical protein
VAVFSGTVATDKSVAILNFLWGFCRGGEGEYIYCDGFLKVSVRWSRSSQESGGREIKKCLQSTDYFYFISIILQIKSV